MHLKELTDSELYKKCQEYGLNSRAWMRRFEGLLPEVYGRRLHRRRGCRSIHEFASKLAGMSHEKVHKILKLAEKLEDKPRLKELFESGEVGYSKLEKVAFIATAEDEGRWAVKVKTLTASALELFVKAEREKYKIDQSKSEKKFCQDNRLKVTDIGKIESVAVANTNYDQSGLFDNVQVSSVKPVRSLTDQQLSSTDETESGWKTISFKISPEVDFQLKLLQNRLEKQKGEKITINELFQELLKHVHQINFAKKSILKAESQAAKKPAKERGNLELLRQKVFQSAEKPAKSRFIPESIRKYIRARQGNKCAFPSCNKPATIFHHTLRFALTDKHDPVHLHLLCEGHERLAHSNLIENEYLAPSKWRIREKPDIRAPEFDIDRSVNRFRKRAAFAA